MAKSQIIITAAINFSREIHRRRAYSWGLPVTRISRAEPPSRKENGSRLYMQSARFTAAKEGFLPARENIPAKKRFTAGPAISTKRLYFVGTAIFLSAVMIIPVPVRETFCTEIPAEAAARICPSSWRIQPP